MSEFKRIEIEPYGPSSVSLQRLDMTKSYQSVNVDGVRVCLPILNLKKYDQDAECYAFIERLQNNQTVIVDILYAYKDILYEFENDESFRREFLKTYNRRYINTYVLMNPVLSMVPKVGSEARTFADAFKRVVDDAIENQMLMMFAKREKQDLEIEILKDPSTIKRDSLFMEAVKDLYEAMSLGLVKIKRPTDPDIEHVKGFMSKEAIMIKSGAMIVNGQEIPRYFATFQTQLKLQEVQIVKDSLAIYLSGVDEQLLVSSPEYRADFGNTILNSNLLETVSSLNANKLPSMSYVGEYNPIQKRIDVNKPYERRFDELNQLLVPSRPAGEGR